jgi:hypothetical protein
LYVTGGTPASQDAGVLYEYTVPGGQYLYPIDPEGQPGYAITALAFEPDSGLLFYGYDDPTSGCQLTSVESGGPAWATDNAIGLVGRNQLISGLAPADGDQELYMTQLGGTLWLCPSPGSLNGLCGALVADGGAPFAALVSAQVRGSYVPFLAVGSSAPAATYQIKCYLPAAGLIPISSQTFAAIPANGMAIGPSDGGSTLFVSDGSQVWAAPACCGTDCATFTAVSGLAGVAPGALAVDPQGQTLYVADSNAMQLVTVPLTSATPP